MKRLVVCASGEGSNFAKILESITEINGEIVGLIVDRECNAIKKAEKNNIPVIRVSRKECLSKKDFDEKLLEAMVKTQADYFILAGFMSILGEKIVTQFEYKIINIHPSLLPAFPGTNSIKKAFDYGVKYTGCTVHFVDTGVDTGPIIAQEVVPILDDYTLEQLTKSIHKAEHYIYPQVIKLLCLDYLKVEKRKVKLMQGEVILNENQKSVN